MQHFHDKRLKKVSWPTVVSPSTWLWDALGSFDSALPAPPRLDQSGCLSLTRADEEVTLDCQLKSQAETPTVRSVLFLCQPRSSSADSSTSHSKDACCVITHCRGGFTSTPLGSRPSTISSSVNPPSKYVHQRMQVNIIPLFSDNRHLSRSSSSEWMITCL